MHILLFMVLSDYIAVIGLLVAIISLFVTIKIAKIIPERDKLAHRKEIRTCVSDLMKQIQNGRNHMCKIIDIDRFDSLYPDNFNSYNRHSHFKVEICENDIHGVVFTDKVLGVTENRKGYFVVNRNESDSHIAERCGLVPYEWIIDIEMSGDECDTTPIFYCKFNKRKMSIGYYYVQSKDGSLRKRFGIYQRRTPFKSYSYYLVQPGNSHINVQIELRHDKDA